MAGARAAGVQAPEPLEPKKATDDTIRYMVGNPGWDPLKVEFSFRQGADPSESRVDDGVRMYQLRPLTELKARAFLGRDKPRDLYDAWFLLSNHADTFNDRTRTEVFEKIRRLGPNYMESEMRSDPILERFDHAAIALELMEFAGN